MHNFLMHISQHLPMKTIAINGEDYLQRYFVHELEDGTQYWLHRFLRNDAERHLHSHPWTARSFILSGGYTEELIQKEHITRLAGSFNDITPQTLHRIAAVTPNTWTLMRVQPTRESEWFFIDDAGERSFVPSSNPLWHLGCATRNDAKQTVA